MDNRHSSSGSRSHRDTFKPRGTSLFTNRQSTTESKPKKMQWDWDSLKNNDNNVEEVSSSRSNSRGLSGRPGDLSSSRNTSGLKRPASAATPTLDSAAKRVKTGQSSSFQKAQRRAERQRSHSSMSRSEADGAASNFSPPPQHRASFFQQRVRTTSEATSTPKPPSRPSFFSGHAKPTLEKPASQSKAPASTSVRKTTGGLFMDDDSDDESDDNSPNTSHQDSSPQTPADAVPSEPHMKNDLPQTREEILKESARRRAEALAKRGRAPESNGLPQTKEEILKETERRRAEALAKRRQARENNVIPQTIQGVLKDGERRRKEAVAKEKQISESKASPASLLQNIRKEAARRQTQPVSPPPLSRPSSSSSKGSSQTLSASSEQDDIIFVGSKTASRAPKLGAESQNGKDAAVQQDIDLFGEDLSLMEDAAGAPVNFDDAAQKAKLDALFVESDEAAKQAETERRRELERQDQAHLKRERQLEQERIKKAAEIKQRAEELRRKQAEVDAENAARRARENQLQETLRRKRDAEAKAKAEKMAAAEKREAERKAEEQKRAREQPPKPSGLSDEQQRAREERIRKQQERNRKMCTHADDFEIVVEDDEPDTAHLQHKSLAQQAREAHQREAHTTTHADVVDLIQPPDRSADDPASFGHVTGGKVATSFDRPMSQIPGIKAPIPSSVTKPGRSLGEVSFDDGKLLHWRDTEGKTFEEIVRFYQALTGKARPEDFLKRRANLVRKALKVANVSWNLINELAKGNEDAKTQINALVDGNSTSQQLKLHSTTSTSDPSPDQRPSHARASGDILPEDAKLLEWEAVSDDWTEIVSKFEQFTGKVKSLSTLRARCRQVEKAIASAGISGNLMARLANGDKAAQTEINARCKDGTSTESRLSSKVGSAPGWKPNSSRLPPEIAPLDAQLVRWRDTGSEWPSIRESWYEATGIRPATDTLKGRYEALKEVFENTLIDDEVLNKVVLGVPGAKEDVNKRIFGAPKPLLPRSLVRIDSAVEERPLIPATRSPRTDSDAPRARIDRVVAEHIRPITNILDAYADHEEVERPTTGGKTINANFLWNAAQNMAQAYEEALEEADESETESEVDPDDPEDYVYYEYTLYRRDEYYDDESDDYEDDEDADSPWVPVSAPFESLKKANAAVQAELLKIKQKRRPIVDPNNMNLTSGTDENGLKWAKFVNDQVGEVEVVVHRKLLKYTDKKLPQSKIDWIPKYFYKVMERQTITEKTTEKVQSEHVDDLFGETAEQIKETETTVARERQMPDLYTDEEQATIHAVKHFAKTTISQKANLTMTDRLRREKEDELLEALEENEIFYKKQIDDLGNKFEVWVEKATMSGPRNI